MVEPISFYADEHIQWSVVKGVRERGISMSHAAEVQLLGKDDDLEQLPYATSIGAVLFTRDHPFASRASIRADHAGLICWTGKETDIGGMVLLLVRFAARYSSEDVVGQVFWLNTNSLQE